MSLDLLSTWNLIRVSGFLSFFLLTASFAFGFLQSFPSLNAKKADYLLIHQTSGWVGLLTILFHMMMLYFDQYVHYSVPSILIPFASENDRFFSGLGTIAFYLFLIVIGTSDLFMKQLGRVVLKKLHYLSIPAWILMVIHGIMSGTDSQEFWALCIYIGSIALILALGVARAMQTVKVPQTNNNNNAVNRTQRTQDMQRTQ